MRICLLTNQDLLANPFVSDDWPCDPRPFHPGARWEVECLEKSTSVEQVARRIRQGFDLVFNLCDGAADQSIPGIEVVQTLEAHGVAFTGATSASPLSSGTPAAASHRLTLRGQRHSVALLKPDLDQDRQGARPHDPAVATPA